MGSGFELMLGLAMLLRFLADLNWKKFLPDLIGFVHILFLTLGCISVVYNQ